MNTLQNIFDDQLKAHYNPAHIGAAIISKHLKEIGIKINNQQLEKIGELFSSNTNGILNIEFTDEQIKSAGFKSDEEISQKLNTLFSDLGDKMEATINQLLESLPELFMDTADSMSEKLLHELKTKKNKILKKQKAMGCGFSSRLEKAYKNAFNLLELQLFIALETGDAFNHEERPMAVISNNYVFEALSRLHARACQVTDEILTLLKAGFADGAHARWRTLHELAVTSIFIRNHGDEVAERYLLHRGVESYKASKTYQNNCNKLGYEPLDDQELYEIKEQHKRLIDRFGKDYENDYGWSANIIKKSKPTFYDIEKDSGLNHLRPFYKMACNNVHAGTTGIFFKLGLCKELGDILLAGPSNLGLTDPGHSASISLTQITTTFLLLNPNLDRVVACKVLSNLENEIGTAFLNAEQAIRNHGK